MKTKITIFKVILASLALATFFSCGNPVALGAKLDVEGPVITITSPSPRKSVLPVFDIEGTAEDYSGVKEMIIKAEISNGEFHRQWRYINGVWEISDNDGNTWRAFEGIDDSKRSAWDGTPKNGLWHVPIDMEINGKLPVEGEYTFNVQAWDKGGFSDDNSFKAIVIIVDFDPPKVDISTPYIYKGSKAYETNPDFKELHDYDDDSLIWRDPAYLGKFLTQEFDLKWQIEDYNDVWSFDLRFYPYDVEIDNDPGTPLPDSYIYKYFQNTPPPPDTIDPKDYVKPNGSVKVPDLTSPAGIYDGGGEIKNSIVDQASPSTGKTTVKVVSVCYDAAGNPNKEKTLGYFIYWPKANSPWIVFTEGMNPPDDYYGRPVGPETPNTIDPEVYMVYPGRSVKATAYQAHGIGKVTYSLYSLSSVGNVLGSVATLEREETTISNSPYAPGLYAKIFPWEFNVPPRTGYYLVKAQAFSAQGIGSEEYTILFRIQDITFPDFTEGPFPIASDPLFKAIDNNKITISGVVSDATEVVSLCLVWINPDSENFKAMSQLSYFRDKEYYGWKEALKLSAGTSDVEKVNAALYPPDKYPYDPMAPNRLWKLNLTPATPPIDNETNRHRFAYSQEIDLSADMNIGTGQKPLQSQVFLLRAENPDGKCTIITYAPQGDTLAPDIKITSMVINGGEPFIPAQYKVVDMFAGGEIITINGTWYEDSLEILPFNQYFLPNFEITVNNQGLPPPVLTPDPGDPTKGTWTITATVKEAPNGAGEIAKDKLKDTLVISVKVADIGGNVAEAGCSWLIESDNLRLMRISSEAEDATYTTGAVIELFLEFSKPVRLSNPVAGKKPELILSSATGNTARAAYKDGQTNQNSRQSFIYTVGAGHSTGTDFLNVTGLYYDGKVYNASDSFDTSGYPFSWSRGVVDGIGYEEVRLTMAAGKDGSKQPDINYYPRTLPTTTVTTNPDYQFTLAAARHLTIDTAAPIVTGVTSRSPTGYYKTGDIYFVVTFNKPVIITGAPQFPLRLSSPATVYTSASPADVRVNENQVTFKYSIQPGDTSNGAPVYVSSSNNYQGGTIYDLAGNALAFNAMSGLGQTARTLTGVYIETNKPSPPTVRVLTAANVNNVISQTVNGASHQGLSTAANKNLSNVYQENLWLAIEGAGAEYKYDTLEYSLNEGTSWIKAGNLTNTPFSLTQTGNNRIVARQTDKAGNTSDPTTAIIFNWDMGALISRISSTNANGIYTHIGGRNQIGLTFYFRKTLTITGSPRITLNARSGTAANPGSGSNINVSSYTASGDTLTFNYTVTNGDQSLAYLAITDFSGITALDSSGVNVSQLLIDNFNAMATPKLEATKQFTVETGSLNAPTLSWAGNGGLETSDDYHGIRSDDGSYWTTLQITYNHTINKGAGTITIQQIAGTGTTAYRMPAVMTEAQYNRFKSNSYTSSVIDTYYTKGTNGYINGSGSDTSNKYVLLYQYDPNSQVTTTDTGFTGNTIILPGVFTNFRDAEKIEINVNASVVTTDGSTLKVRLSGSSAPQVPGATYTVTLPSGLVTDSLGNISVTTSTNIALDGVAKPFVRIKKTQDTIAVHNTPSISQPRLVATQPLLANARMDCRTPGSAITYNASTGQTNVTGNNPGIAGTNNNWNYETGPTDNATPNATRPANATATSYTNSNQLTIGYTTGTTSPTIENVQGFQWWVRARAGVGATYSSETEEMAYRTVISYSIRTGNAAIANASGRSIFQDGDQAWIRGGDAIGSSSIPGFPFTWEDDWSKDAEALKDKRAGIRLMTLVLTTATNATMNNSLWRFVTWDMNTTAYIDFIRGRDLGVTENNVAYTASDAASAWQYGPKRWCYQVDGWTSFKEKYPIYAGKHRWCDMGYMYNPPHQVLNFSGTFMARPDLTASSSTYNRWPGLNVQ